MSMLRAHHNAGRVAWRALRFTFPPNPPTQSMTFVGFRVFIKICGLVWGAPPLTKSQTLDPKS